MLYTCTVHTITKRTSSEVEPCVYQVLALFRFIILKNVLVKFWLKLTGAEKKHQFNIYNMYDVKILGINFIESTFFKGSAFIIILKI